MAQGSNIEVLAELNPDAMIAEGLEEAYIGYTLNHHANHVAVYDVAVCVEIIRSRDNIGREEARNFLHANTFSAYIGENTPIFVEMDYVFDETFDIEDLMEDEDFEDDL